MRHVCETAYSRLFQAAVPAEECRLRIRVPIEPGRKALPVLEGVQQASDSGLVESLLQAVWT